MARPGILYQDIANAAQELVAQGKYPTIESIRQLTGTGSNSTIAQHLKTWKAKQDRTSVTAAKENLPEEVISCIKGLWSQLLDHAGENVSVIKEASEQKVAELNDNIHLLKQENSHWQQRHQQLAQEHTELISAKSALEQTVRQLEDKNITHTVAHEKMLQVLEEKQQQINELKRLHKQAQENLEHYREATREKHMADLQRQEQLQMQLQQTIQQLQKENKEITEQRNALQYSYADLNALKNSIQGNYDQLIAHNNILKTKLAQVENDIVKHQISEQHWQTQCHKTHEKADEQTNKLIQLEKQIAVLGQKLSDAERSLNEMDEQHKQLSNEKWALAQENARLTGELKFFGKLEAL